MLIYKTKSITLNFGDEYYEDEEDDIFLPRESGVYCVYTAVIRNNQEKAVNRLLYIGKSEQEQGMYDRLPHHERRSDFLAELDNGEKLCYACAVVEDDEERKLAEAAMIYKHKPPLNDYLKNHYSYEPVSVHVKGTATALLESNFTTVFGE